MDLLQIVVPHDDIHGKPPGGKENCENVQIPEKKLYNFDKGGSSSSSEWAFVAAVC